MDILFISDDRYINPTLVALTSVCVNNLDTDITFHILMDKSTSEDCESPIVSTAGKYGKRCCVHRYDFSEYERFLPIGRNNMPMHCSIATYYRLFLCDILPETISKVLYLDGDLIVRGSLYGLWSSKVDDVAIMGVRDCWEGDVSKYNRLKYHPHYGYMNAGVILLNLDYWRKNDIQGELISYLNSCSDRIVHHDQDVLNACLFDRKSFLGFKYNVQDGFLMNNPNLLLLGQEEEFEESLTHPVIIHYCSSDKPWLPDTKHPYAKEYEKYMEIAGLRKKDFPSRILTKREVLRGILVRMGLFRDVNLFRNDLCLED